MNRYNNSKTRSDVRAQLIAERGKVCEHCKTTKSKSGKEYAKMSESELSKFLVMHEIDHNKKNLESANLLILCKGCNLKIERERNLTPFEKRLEALNRTRTETRMYKQNEILNYGNEGMRRNAVGMPRVRRWLDEQLEEKTILEVAWFIPNAASVGEVTQRTIEEWLEVLTCDSDNYKLINNKTYLTRRAEADGLQKKYNT